MRKRRRRENLQRNPYDQRLARLRNGWRRIDHYWQRLLTQVMADYATVTIVMMMMMMRTRVARRIMTVVMFAGVNCYLLVLVAVIVTVAVAVAVVMAVMIVCRYVGRRLMLRTAMVVQKGMPAADNDRHQRIAGRKKVGQK